MPYIIGSPDEAGIQGIILWGYVICKEGTEPVKETIFDGVPRLSFRVNAGVHTTKSGIKVYSCKNCSIFGNSRTAVEYGKVKNLRKGDYVTIFGKLQTYAGEDEDGIKFETQFVRIDTITIAEPSDESDRSAIGLSKRELKRIDEMNGEEDYSF